MMSASFPSALECSDTRGVDFPRDCKGYIAKVPVRVFMACNSMPACSVG